MQEVIRGHFLAFQPTQTVQTDTTLSYGGPLVHHLGTSPWNIATSTVRPLHVHDAKCCNGEASNMHCMHEGMVCKSDIQLAILLRAVCG